MAESSSIQEHLRGEMGLPSTKEGVLLKSLLSKGCTMIGVRVPRPGGTREEWRAMSPYDQDVVKSVAFNGGSLTPVRLRVMSNGNCVSVVKVSE